MVFQNTGDQKVDDELIKNYNFQKNLEISDPSENPKKILSISVETDYLNSFMFIKLINIYKQALDTTEEL